MNPILKRLSDQKRDLFTLLVLPAIGVMALFLATQRGIGLTPDSVTYITQARNLAAGTGITRAHYPPGYPFFLALPILVGIDPVSGARWLQLALFPLNILAVELIIHRYARNIWVAILGAFLSMSYVGIVELHAAALSEGLFLLLSLTGFAFLARYLERSSRRYLVVASGAIALAMLTRYVGIALLVAGAASILVLGKGEPRRRVLDSLGFAALAFAPLGAWLVRNLTVAGDATGREVAFHPIGASHLESAVSTIYAWLLTIDAPIPAKAIVSLLAVIAIGIVVATASRQPEWRSVSGLFRVLASFSAIYIVSLSLSISFVDASTPMDSRLLSPVFVSMVMAIVLATSTLGRSSKYLGIALVALSIVLVGSYAVNSAKAVAELRTNGMGYSRKLWQESQLMARIRTIPSTTPLYTNAPDAISILAGRAAEPVPYLSDPITGLPNAGYQTAVSRMMDDMGSHGAILAYFDSITWRRYMPSIGDLEKIIPVREVWRSEDGGLYGLDGGSPVTSLNTGQ